MPIMKSLEIKKILGISFCGFFGAALIGRLSNYAISLFEWYDSYSSIGFTIFWILVNLISMGAMLYIAINKKVFTSPLGQVLTFLMAALCATFAISHIASRFQVNIYSFLGTYASVIIGVVELVIMAGIMFLSKTWLPIKILATSIYIPSIITSLYIIKLNAAWELYDKTSDYSVVEGISKLIATWNLIGFILILATVILTIIWMCMRTAAPSTQNQKIDLI